MSNDSDDHTDKPIDSSLSDLFSAEHVRIERWFRGAVGSREVAQDLAQDTFLAVQRSWSPQVREPRAFLFFVAHRVLRAHFRHKRVTAKIFERESATPVDIVDPSSSPPEWLARDEAVRLGQAIMDELPKQERETMRRRISGLSAADIAAELKIDVTRVYKLTARAVARCQAKLRALGIHGDDEG